MSRGAVVLGGGIAGMLAASVLARQMDVTIVERDRLPRGAEARKGLPQSSHGHLVLPGGIRAMERLLPGVTEELTAAGAVRLGVPNDVLFLSGQGWMPRLPEALPALSSSRALLDWGVRERVLREERVTVLDGTDVEGLIGDRQRVTGARVRNRRTGQPSSLDARIVVDATGMSSRCPNWLRALGTPAIKEERVDTGLAYSSRLYLAPPNARENFPAVFVRANAGVGHPGQAAAILPIENGQWLACVSGTRGAEPPTDIDGFERFARSLRHGVIADLLAQAQPLSSVRGFRNNVNRRRHFPRLPNGFLALGDAAQMTSPAYAHGMSLAAIGALVLRDGLTHRQGSQRIQRRILRETRLGWRLAVQRDALYPGATGTRPRLAGTRRRVLNRVHRLAAGDPALFGRLLTGYTLSGPLRGIARPTVAWRVLRGAPALPSGEAPLTETEWASVRECARWSA